MGKASRQKGAAREKQQFVCWCHEVPFRAPLRFKAKDTWADWSLHNRNFHHHVPYMEEWVHWDEDGAFIGGQEVVLL